MLASRRPGPEFGPQRGSRRIIPQSWANRNRVAVCRELAEIFGLQ